MRRPPRPTRTDTRLPYTTLLRSHGLQRLAHRQITLRCCGEAHMRAVDLDSPVALPGASLGAAGQDHAVPPRPERDRRHPPLSLAPAREGRPADGKSGTALIEPPGMLCARIARTRRAHRQHYPPPAPRD